MSSKVIASHDIGSVKQKIASNANLNSDIISKRMEEAEEEKSKSLAVPKELRGLEDLIFLGFKTKDIDLGTFQFTIRTISTANQELILKKALLVPEEERILFFKKGLLAMSLYKINGKTLDLYFEEDSFEFRLNLVDSLQQSIFDVLFEQVDLLVSSARDDIKVDNLKK